MKKIYFLLLVFISIQVKAQVYCTPAVIPYASTMPGITHFVLNTIDRTSAALEHVGSGFVTTGMSTNLMMGDTYTVSITHTVDASICPDMNIRVWIDYNHDGQLDDIGETVISTDHHAPGTYTATFTVPLTATSGNTRLRATVKMSDIGGHSLPTPCNSPPDPLGYHGEMEDYTVNLISPTGISETSSFVSSIQVFPMPAGPQSKLQFAVSDASHIAIELYNELGEKVSDLFPTEMKLPGLYEYSLAGLSGLRGLYFLKLSSEHGTITKPVVVCSPD